MIVHSVKMPVGNGRIATKSRPLETMVHLKSSIVEVKKEDNCLDHALIISITKLTNDPNYKAYIQGRKIRPVVDHLLATRGIDVTNGGGIAELMRFQEHFKEYRIVFGGLNFEDILFDCLVDSEERINLIYGEVTRHYHVINSLTGALTGKSVCRGCNKRFDRGETHRCQEMCSDYVSSTMSIP